MSETFDPATHWECLSCARVVPLAADDYCPHCGRELPEFGAYRPDGWPLCPGCGEDELYSRYVPPLDAGPPAALLAAHLADGVKCYRCGWQNKEWE